MLSREFSDSHTSRFSAEELRQLSAERSARQLEMYASEPDPEPVYRHGYAVREHGVRIPSMRLRETTRIRPDAAGRIIHRGKLILSSDGMTWWRSVEVSGTEPIPMTDGNTVLPHEAGFAIELDESVIRALVSASIGEALVRQAERDEAPRLGHRWIDGGDETACGDAQCGMCLHAREIRARGHGLRSAIVGITWQRQQAVMVAMRHNDEAAAELHSMARAMARELIAEHQMLPTEMPAIGLYGWGEWPVPWSMRPSVRVSLS